jgi:hypothetical protein
VVLEQYNSMVDVVLRVMWWASVRGWAVRWRNMKYGGTNAGVQCSAFSRFEENKFPPQDFSSEFPGISDGDKKKPLLRPLLQHHS